MTDTTKIDIPAERKQAYDFIDANPSMPQSERLIKFAALARKQERLECCKSMCVCCGEDADDYAPAELRNGKWKHKWKDGTGYAMCGAWPIHERNLAETGG